MFVLPVSNNEDPSVVRAELARRRRAAQLAARQLVEADEPEGPRVPVRGYVGLTRTEPGPVVENASTAAETPAKDRALIAATWTAGGLAGVALLVGLVLLLAGAL